MDFLDLRGERREGKNYFSKQNLQRGCQRGRINEFSDHRAVQEKWRAAFSDLVYSGSCWGGSTPQASPQGPAH